MEDEYEDYKETLEEAKKIKKALSLESIDTALLIMLMQDIDQIRFNSSD